MGGISFAWVTDPRSGAKVVKLLGGLPVAKLKEFNRQRSAQLQALSCEELEMLPYGGGTENAKEVHFASKKFLSVGGTVGFYSGGTTGNQDHDVETYDLVSLRPIRAEELFKSVRDTDSKPTQTNRRYPLMIEGTPRNLEDLIWQEGWKLTKKWPNLTLEEMGEAANDPTDQRHSDIGEKWALYLWFGGYSTCEWDDQDRPVRCSLDSDDFGTKVMLTRKGLAVLVYGGKNLGDFLIPWNRAAAVLRPGVTLK